MALPNPTINPPALPRPDHTAAAAAASSRSPSASPTRATARRLQSISQDPLLRDLSPTKTLNAFTMPGNTPLESNLVKSVEYASDEDKAFGARVARACKDLRQWATEVEAWHWPGTFAPPAQRERKSKRKDLLADHQVDPSHFYDDSDDEEGGFWGSLPRELVQAYELRIEEIQKAMIELDIEGLKSHVRSVHILPKSNTDQKRDEYVSFRVRSMDDFTALITATILQALPYMSWLNRLLNEWSVRLAVLRRVPGFLHGLADTQLQLETAWKQLVSDSFNSQESVGPVRARIEALQTVLGSKVSALGQRLDSMLDELEGRPESLPDRWIDDFEALELAYSSWVVRVERIMTGLAWEFDLPASTAGTPAPSFDGLGITTEPPAASLRNQSLASMDSSRQVDSPTLGIFPYDARDRNRSVATKSVMSHRGRDNSEYTRFVDDIIYESQDQAHDQHMPDTMTMDFADEHTAVTDGAVRDRDEPNQAPAPPPKTSPSPGPRLRHIPINVDAYRDAALQSSIEQMNQKAEEPYSLHREPPLPSIENEEADAAIGGYAAAKSRFSGDLENKQALAKTQSPVRSFEHASTAFTRLFRPSTRDSSRSRSRSNTLKKNRPQSRKGHVSQPSNASSKYSEISSPVLPSASVPKKSEELLRDPPALDIIESPLPAAQSPSQDTVDYGTSSPHDSRNYSDKVVLEEPRPASVIEMSPNLGKFNQWDSPMALATGNEFWPAETHYHSTDEEISSPGSIIPTDAFESMFVDTLPVSPILYNKEAFATNLAAFEEYVQEIRSYNNAYNPVTGVSVLDEVYGHPDEDMKARRSRPTQKHGDNKRKHRRNESADFASTYSVDAPSLAESQSTAEIQEASTAGFGRAHEVSSPRRSHEVSSPRRSTRSERTHIDEDNASTIRGSTYAQSKSRLFIASDSDGEGSGDEKVSSLSTPFVTSYYEHEDEADIEEDAGMSYSALPKTNRDRSDTTHSEPIFPMPPSFRESSHSRTHSEMDTKPTSRTLRSDSQRSLMGSKLGATKPLPLAITAMKRNMLDGGAKVQETAREADSPSGSRHLDSELSPREASSDMDIGDNLDRHVSRVLRKMTSNIHFRPGNKSRLSGLPKMHHRSGRNSAVAQSDSEGLTITPAHTSEPSLKHHLNTGDMKLYNLLQPGKAQPIKLFVRLVGADERVMVRVGGGWMDLEEYLRQYAEHHTHRTISDGPLEVTEASRVETKASPESRRSSGANLLSPIVADVPEQSADVTENADAHFVNEVKEEESAQSPATPQQSSDKDDTSESVSTAFSSTGATVGDPDPLRSNPLVPQVKPTPERPMSMQVRTSSSGSKTGPSLFPRVVPMSTPPPRPASVLATPSTGSTNGSSSGAKAGLEAQKARWVEMMLDKARSGTSVEKTSRRASRSSWQHLGGTGGVRRLAMRSSSGTKAN